METVPYSKLDRQQDDPRQAEEHTQERSEGKPFLESERGVDQKGGDVQPHDHGIAHRSGPGGGFSQSYADLSDYIAGDFYGKDNMAKMLMFLREREII